MSQNDIRKAASQLRKLIAQADLKAIRNFCQYNPLLCNEIYNQFAKKYKGNPPINIKRLLEALKGLKEGAFATNKREMIQIMKNYVPSDHNLRQFPWYRKRLGGAWLLWQLGSPWNEVVKDGLIWSRAWICPIGSNLKAELFPVADLAFSPLNQHKLIKCEQIIQKPGQKPEIMSGAAFHQLPDKVKLQIGKAPADIKKKKK